MKKFMYWLWGVAEEREFCDGPLSPFWAWLTRLCDRYHGYKHDSLGNIICKARGWTEGGSNATGPATPPDRPYPFGNGPFI